MNRVLFRTEGGHPPYDGMVYRIVQVVGADDCVVEFKNADAEEGYQDSDWEAVDSDGTCAEVYMLAFLQAKAAYDALALGVGSLAARFGLTGEKRAGGPIIDYTDPPGKPLSELRASDVPRGADSDDLVEQD